MGLGIGVRCESCNEQLKYDSDGKEINKYTDLDDCGRQYIIRRPVLCHRCEELREKLMALPPEHAVGRRNRDDECEIVDASELP